MKIKKFVADDHPAIQAYALALSRERKWKNEEDWAVRYWSKFAFGKAIGFFEGYCHAASLNKKSGIRRIDAVCSFTHVIALWKRLADVWDNVAKREDWPSNFKNPWHNDDLNTDR